MIFRCDSCDTEKDMELYHAEPNSLQYNGWVTWSTKTIRQYFCSECFFYWIKLRSMLANEVSSS